MRDGHRLGELMLKWIGGIVGTILGGAALWWLTTILFPQMFHHPHLVFTVVEIRTPATPGWIPGKFTVTNDGTATAEDCMLTWNTGVPHEDFQEAGFSLLPSQNHSWATNALYQTTGTF